MMKHRRVKSTIGTLHGATSGARDESNHIGGIANLLNWNLEHSIYRGCTILIGLICLYWVKHRQGQKLAALLSPTHFSTTHCRRMTPLLLLLLAVGASRAADYPDAAAAAARGAPAAATAPLLPAIGAGGRGPEGGGGAREALTVLKALGGEATEPEPDPTAREKPPTATAAASVTGVDAARERELPRSDHSAAASTPDAAAGRASSKPPKEPPRSPTSSPEPSAAPPAAAAAAAAAPAARAPAPRRSMFPSIFDDDGPRGQPCTADMRGVPFDAAGLAAHCGGGGRVTRFLGRPDEIPPFSPAVFHILHGGRARRLRVLLRTSPLCETGSMAKARTPYYLRGSVFLRGPWRNPRGSS
jgi:pyruvate/2-oxoglutarate dehydrogenase complex dihydrolipoamide acyltransferase (E2) component